MIRRPLAAVLLALVALAGCTTPAATEEPISAVDQEACFSRPFGAYLDGSVLPVPGARFAGEGETRLLYLHFADGEQIRGGCSQRTMALTDVNGMPLDGAFASYGIVPDVRGFTIAFRVPASLPAGLDACRAATDRGAPLPTDGYCRDDATTSLTLAYGTGRLVLTGLAPIEDPLVLDYIESDAARTGSGG